MSDEYPTLTLAYSELSLDSGCGAQYSIPALGFTPEDLATVEEEIAALSQSQLEDLCSGGASPDQTIPLRNPQLVMAVLEQLFATLEEDADAE